jgi:probable rRNA maturation factor
MIEVEVFGASLAPAGPSPQEIERLCARAAAVRGIHDAHVAIEFVDAARIARLNVEHRGKHGPTDVLSFPIDGVEAIEPDASSGAQDPAGDGRTGNGGLTRRALPRELGDVVICPQHTTDVREAIVHGVLHLLGMDHEQDDGEMLALQREVLAR